MSGRKSISRLTSCEYRSSDTSEFRLSRSAGSAITTVPPCTGVVADEDALLLVLSLHAVITSANSAKVGQREPDLICLCSEYVRETRCNVRPSEGRIKFIGVSQSL